jgi:hypothetical protein
MNDDRVVVAEKDRGVKRAAEQGCVCSDRIQCWLDRGLRAADNLQDFRSSCLSLQRFVQIAFKARDA